MKILNFSSGQDTGGQQGRSLAGFQRYARDWDYQIMTRRRTFYRIRHRYHPTLVRAMWRGLDAIHIHNGIAAAAPFRDLGPKPMLVHYHGTSFRQDPLGNLSQLQGLQAKAIVSTLDLHALASKQTEWLPAPYQLDQFPKKVQRNDKQVVISHAPTNRLVKSTKELYAAVKQLKEEGYPIRLDLIEREPWGVCIARKAQSDIYVDQLMLGYGCNAIEAWAMGIPVVAGVDVKLTQERLAPQKLSPKTLPLMKKIWGQLPFLSATESTLTDVLRSLVEDAVLRKQWGDIGREHVWQWHDDRKVVPILQRMYMEVADSEQYAAAV